MSLIYLDRLVDWYTVLLAFVWTAAFVTEFGKGEKFRSLYWLVVIVLVLFSASRYETGFDWPAYRDFYMSLTEEGSSKWAFEIGFVYLARALKNISVDFDCFLAVATTLQVVLIAVFIRLYFGLRSMLVLAIYYTVPIFFLISAFSLMRQGISVSFFLIGSFLYIRNRKPASYFLFLLSASFHYSSIAAIIIFLVLSRIRISIKVALVVFIVGLISFILRVNLPRAFLEPVFGLEFFSKYVIYLNLDVATDNFLVVVIQSFFYIIAFFALILSRTKQLARGNMSCATSHTFNLAIFFVMLSIWFWGFPTIVSRYQLFFVFFFLGWLFFLFDFRRVENRLFMVLFAFFLCSILYLKFVLTPTSLVYFPYQSILVPGVEEFSSGEVRTQALYEILRGSWNE